MRRRALCLVLVVVLCSIAPVGDDAAALERWVLWGPMLAGPKPVVAEDDAEDYGGGPNWTHAEVLTMINALYLKKYAKKRPPEPPPPPADDPPGGAP